MDATVDDGATPSDPAQPVRGPTWITYDDRSSSQVHITFDFAAVSPRLESRAARAVLSEILRGRVELVRTEMLASYGIDSDYWSLLAGDVELIPVGLFEGGGGASPAACAANV